MADMFVRKRSIAQTDIYLRWGEGTAWQGARERGRGSESVVLKWSRQYLAIQADESSVFCFVLF